MSFYVIKFSGLLCPVSTFICCAYSASEIQKEVSLLQGYRVKGIKPCPMAKFLASYIYKYGHILPEQHITKCLTYVFVINSHS